MLQLPIGLHLHGDVKRPHERMLGGNYRYIVACHSPAQSHEGQRSCSSMNLSRSSAVWVSVQSQMRVDAY